MSPARLWFRPDSTSDPEGATMRKALCLAGAVVAMLAVVLMPSQSWAWMSTDYVVKNACSWVTKGTSGATQVTPTSTCFQGSTGPSADVQWANVPRPSSGPCATGGWAFASVPGGSGPPAVNGPFQSAAGQDATKTYLSGFGRDLVVQKSYDVYLVTYASGVNGVPGFSISGVCSLFASVLTAPRGGTIEAPIDPTTVSTCDSFRHISTAVTEGTVDLSFSWVGAAPPRGWTVTDAGKKQPVGAGATLVQIPGTPLDAGGQAYGLREWSVPAGVASFRVQVRGTPGCFTGFDVLRDGAGNVTGVSAVGTGGPNGAPDLDPHTDPPKNGTDEDGADCGRFDVFCQVRALLIPDPSSWGFGELKTQVQDRPPFSVGVSVVTAIGGIVSAYNNPDECAYAPFIRIPGILEPTAGGAGCNDPGISTGNGPFGGAGWADSPAGLIIFGLIRLFLYGATAFLMWGMVESAFGDHGGGDA